MSIKPGEAQLAFDLPTFVDSISSGETLIGEHLTLHRVPAFRSSTAGSVFLTNSLLISVTNNLVFTGGPDVVTNLNDSGYFQTAAAGQYYLAAGSPHRNAGTANINSNLLSELKARTTYPPILVFSNTFASDVTLAPQAARDTDAPDIGYHYDPIDYSIGALTATNVNVVVQPGTALATYATSASFALVVAGQSQFRCEGTPTALNRIVRYDSVQEINTNWGPSAHGIATGTASGADPVLVRLRFTDWVGNGLDAIHLHGGVEHAGRLEFLDSQMFGGTVISARPSANFTNSLFSGSSLWLEDNGGSYQPGHSGRNNLIHRSLLEFDHQTADTWTWRDNFVAESTVNEYGSFVGDGDYNAYTTNTWRLGANSGSFDVLLATNTVPFQSGPLGLFYLPTAGPGTNLFNTGSTNADLRGFYHYTTTTNQMKETNSTVDIGFHLIALNGPNQPLDSDGDGIPDWLEDLNGNGSVNSGETVWTNATDLGLKVQITNPRSNSPLP